MIAEEKNEREAPPLEDGRIRGRVVSVKKTYGFIQPLSSSGFHSRDAAVDVFFSAGDVSGSNGSRGESRPSDSDALEISSGKSTFWLIVDDEVTYNPATVNGKVQAEQVMKEAKGSRGSNYVENPSDHLKRLEQHVLDKNEDALFSSMSSITSIMDHGEFAVSHMQRLVEVLASDILIESERSDSILRRYYSAKSALANLRTSVLQLQGFESMNGSAQRRAADYLRSLARLFAELTLRFPISELQDVIPVVELGEAAEAMYEELERRPEDFPLDLDRLGNNFRFLKKSFPQLNVRFLISKKERRRQPDYVELQALQYQDMPVLPVMEEILEGSRFHIEPNTRTYKDAETYIQTHFMLLREDYVDPVREGIRAYLARKHSEKDVHVYLKVKVFGLVSARDGLVYRLKMPLCKDIQWDKTRRLMNGLSSLTYLQ
jgi:hypothetical protein